VLIRALEPLTPDDLDRIYEPYHDRPTGSLPVGGIVAHVSIGMLASPAELGIFRRAICLLPITWRVLCSATFNDARLSGKRLTSIFA
jgi:hypothetical protein